MHQVHIKCHALAVVGIICQSSPSAAQRSDTLECLAFIDSHKFEMLEVDPPLNVVSPVA